MADDIDTSGPVDTGEAASEPKVVYVPDVESRQEHVKEAFNAGLALTAHATEDATDFVRERETQEKFLAGEDLSPAQMREWHERTHAALQRGSDARHVPAVKFTAARNRFLATSSLMRPTMPNTSKPRKNGSAIISMFLRNTARRKSSPTCWQFMIRKPSWSATT